MTFQLPRLTVDIECDPIGYKGLFVTYWLNLPYDTYTTPENPEPWETAYFYALGRMVISITFPADMTFEGVAETYPIDDSKALWDLWNTPGFDQQIILWSLNQYQVHRQERLDIERKN